MRTSAVIVMNVILTANILIASPGNGQSAAERRINLDFKNTLLKKVFKAIEGKSRCSNNV